MIDRVTITGADDSIKPEHLIQLTRNFPFVEWGILASYNNTIVSGGCNRYPSPKWITDLQTIAETTGELPNLAIHFNGKWVRELLTGDFAFPENLLHCFGRVQLNFHGEQPQFSEYGFVHALRKFGGKQIIFQIDGVSGDKYLQAVYADSLDKTPDCVSLFDVSGGAGILPDKWPKPKAIDVQSNGEESREYWAYCGYAGGLGPENLDEQIPRILDASSSTMHTHEGRIWIDMETRVRSKGDQVFDLQKVRRCLEIAAPWVNLPAPVTN